MIRFPNAFMLSENERTQLEALFRVVEKTPAFKEFSKHKWSFTDAELLTIEQVRNGYVATDQEWVISLRDAIAHTSSIAVFGLCNKDRRGLEHFPSNVQGRTLTFFLDAKSECIAFMINGVYSI